MFNSLFLHEPHHEFYRFFLEDDRVVRPEGPYTYCIVDRHQRLDASTELSIILFSQVMSSQISAYIHEVLYDRGIAEIPSTHQRRNAGIVGRIHFGSKVHEQFDDFQPFGVGFSPAVAIDPRISCGLHERRLVVAGHNVRISAVRQEESDQFHIGGKCRAPQRCSERGPRCQIQRGSTGRWNVVDERVRIRSGGQKFLDQGKRIGGHHPRHTRIGFHIAAIHGPE